MGGWTPTEVKPSLFMPCTPSRPEFFQHHSTDQLQRGGMLFTVTKVVNGWGGSWAQVDTGVKPQDMIFKNKQNLYKCLRRVLHHSRHHHPPTAPPPQTPRFKDVSVSVFAGLHWQTGLCCSEMAGEGAVWLSRMLWADSCLCSLVWNGTRFSLDILTMARKQTQKHVPQGTSNYSQALGENKQEFI